VERAEVLAYPKDQFNGKAYANLKESQQSGSFLFSVKSARKLSSKKLLTIQSQCDSIQSYY